jgi:hypothetical protein
MFAQKSGCYHSYPVMHVTGFVKLLHPCIYDLIACFPPAPSTEFLIIVPPGDVIVITAEITCYDMREME